jgi:hypothetical protein
VLWVVPTQFVSSHSGDRVLPQGSNFMATYPIVRPQLGAHAVKRSGQSVTAKPTTCTRTHDMKPSRQLLRRPKHSTCLRSQQVQLLMPLRRGSVTGFFLIASVRRFRPIISSTECKNSEPSVIHHISTYCHLLPMLRLTGFRLCIMLAWQRVLSCDCGGSISPPASSGMFSSQLG